MFDYSKLGPKLEALGLLEGLDLIVVPHWIEASMLSTGLGGAYPVRLLKGNRHHFPFMSGETATGPALLLDVALLAKSDKRGERLLKTGREIDPDAELLEPVILERGGVPYLAVSVVRLRVTE